MSPPPLYHPPRCSPGQIGLKKYNEICDKISSLLKKDLIVNQCIMINILELR